MKFRKKPIEIEAILWDGDKDKVNDFIGLKSDPDEAIHAFANDNVFIQTLEGVMTVNIGDWIIKGVAGEFYPCKPDIFCKTYQPSDFEAEDFIEALKGAGAISQEFCEKCTTTGHEASSPTPAE